MRTLKFSLVVLLALLLTSCSSVLGPNRAAIESAIALQVRDTQSQLGRVLLRGTSQLPMFSINAINISDRESLTIEKLRSYRVAGTYDLTLQVGDRQVKQGNNPFEVYLQRDVENETWKPARRQVLEDGTESWLIIDSVE